MCRSPTGPNFIIAETLPSKAKAGRADFMVMTGGGYACADFIRGHDRLIMKKSRAGLEVSPPPRPNKEGMPECLALSDDGQTAKDVKGHHEIDKAMHRKYFVR
jgi:hypothetical protein